MLERFVTADSGGPCHVLMSGLSIMQYLMREQAEITHIVSTKLSTVVRNTLEIVPPPPQKTVFPFPQ